MRHPPLQDQQQLPASQGGGAKSGGKKPVEQQQPPTAKSGGKKPVERQPPTAGALEPSLFHGSRLPLSSRAAAAMEQLGDGWELVRVPRLQGTTDNHYIAPSGQRFRSFVEAMRHVHGVDAPKAQRQEKASRGGRARSDGGGGGGEACASVGERPRKWSCVQCTLINSALAKKCKLCEAPKPRLERQQQQAEAPKAANSVPRSNVVSTILRTMQ